MTQTPSTFRLNKASESFLDWIDEGGVPMPDTRFDTAMMLRKIEAEAKADAEATIARLRAVLEALWTAVTNDGDETTLTLAAEDAEAALSDTPAQDYGLIGPSEAIDLTRIVEKAITPWREALRVALARRDALYDPMYDGPDDGDTELAAARALLDSKKEAGRG